MIDFLVNDNINNLFNNCNLSYIYDLINEYKQKLAPYLNNDDMITININEFKELCNSLEIKYYNIA
jgi:hypothetical protein